MKVTITVADETGQTHVHDQEYSSSSARGTGAASGGDVRDAGSPASAAAPGNGQVFQAAQSGASQGAQAAFPPGPSLPAVDAGAPPDWLTDLVQLAEAGQVPRPGEDEVRQGGGASTGGVPGPRNTDGATDAGSPAQPRG